jgi:hypothetical protein
VWNGRSWCPLPPWMLGPLSRAREQTFQHAERLDVRSGSGTAPANSSCLSVCLNEEFHLMMKSRLTIAALVIAGLAGSPFAASAKMYKHSKHQTSTKSSTTTGANMKSSTGAKNPSASGNMSGGGNANPGTTNNNSAPSGK